MEVAVVFLDVADCNPCKVLLLMLAANHPRHAAVGSSAWFTNDEPDLLCVFTGAGSAVSLLSVSAGQTGKHDT